MAGNGQNNRSQNGNDRLQVLVFSVGKEVLALPLSALDQILVSPPCTPVPHARAPIRGVVNASGRTVLTLSLAELLELPSSRKPEEQWMIVCASQPATGFWVDTVHRNVWIEANAMQPVPPESRLRHLAKGLWGNETLSFCLLDEHRVQERADEQIVSFVASLRFKGEESS